MSEFQVGDLMIATDQGWQSAENAKVYAGRVFRLVSIGRIEPLTKDPERDKHAWPAPIALGDGRFKKLT